MDGTCKNGVTFINTIYGSENKGERGKRERGRERERERKRGVGDSYFFNI